MIRSDRLAALGLLFCAAAHAQMPPPSGPPRNPFENRPGQDPQFITDQKGEFLSGQGLERRELFTVNGMSFQFVDPEKRGKFVRPAENDTREAIVKVQDKSKGFDRTLRLIVNCTDKTYFMDLVTLPLKPLKPLEAGTVTELLLKRACE